MGLGSSPSRGTNCCCETDCFNCLFVVTRHYWRVIQPLYVMVAYNTLTVGVVWVRVPQGLLITNLIKSKNYGIFR